MTSQKECPSLNALPPGTVLHDYVIDSELGSGGFNIVYLARHRLNTDWLFAIKEYFPREVVARDGDGGNVRPVNTEADGAFEDGLRRFRDEAEQLRRFRNERYIVSCLKYFEANGTAYLVMDHDDGLPLSEFLRRREAAGQPFTEADLRAVVEPLLEGLAVVHQASVLHRDIKPGNIFVRRPDDITGRPAQPVLIDFGAAKQNYLARHSRSQAPYTPGYAAYEQVSSEGHQEGHAHVLEPLGHRRRHVVRNEQCGHVEAFGLMKDWTEGCGSETSFHFGCIGDRSFSLPDTDQRVNALAVEFRRNFGDPARNANAIRDRGYDRMQEFIFSSRVHYLWLSMLRGQVSMVDNLGRRYANRRTATLFQEGHFVP